MSRAKEYKDKTPAMRVAELVAKNIEIQQLKEENERLKHNLTESRLSLPVSNFSLQVAKDELTQAQEQLTKYKEALKESNEMIWEVLEQGVEGSFPLRSQYDKNRNLLNIE